MNILVFGDSHSKIFNYCNCKQKQYRFNLCEVGGATALGLVNPNSKTNALPIFADTIQKVKKHDKVILMIGEVDCGFVIWVRSKKYNISVDDQINQSVNNLFDFIKKELIEKGQYNCNDIIVCGSVLPTIRDSTDKRYLGGARSEVQESQFTRTLKTLEYNNMLKSKCNKNGYLYMDITNHIINENGIVKSEFLNKNPYDHHLDNATTYYLWLIELNKLLNNYNRSKHDPQTQA